MHYNKIMLQTMSKSIHLNTAESPCGTSNGKEQKKEKHNLCKQRQNNVPGKTDDSTKLTYSFVTAEQ
jgi:hypothetical protein